MLADTVGDAIHARFASKIDCEAAGAGERRAVEP
jgi:hypothetical protein